MAKIKLGCIADDFTGATDLANNLVRAGLRVLQTLGVPSQDLIEDVDAVVVALKSRTIAPELAIAQSLQALSWLQTQGAQQIYFKYCSTFDSLYSGELRGNIGPVTEALMAALGVKFTIATPAFPDNQRTVFKGYLFVGDVLLNESGMQNHPLTPMRDANLVRVLQAQCQGQVGLIDHKTVAQGAAAMQARMTQLEAQGVSIAVVDALSNDDLLRMGPAFAELALVTAGSGVAIGLPQNFGLSAADSASVLPVARGLQAVVAGSCSLATQKQVAHFIASGRPALALDPQDIAADQARGVDAAAKVLRWAQPLLASGPVLIYSTADAEAVRSSQDRLGAEQAGALIEQTLGRITRGLVDFGVRQLVVAGGETSGACIQALQIGQMKIGGQIDPGVPWCHAQLGPELAATGGPGAGLHLALKSGNFGSDDFFSKAFTMLA